MLLYTSGSFMVGKNNTNFRSVSVLPQAMKLSQNKKPARYKRFSYEPRSFDPVKEDIAARRQRIKEQIDAGQTSGFDSRDPEERQYSNRTLNRKIILWALGISFFITLWSAYKLLSLDAPKSAEILAGTLSLLLLLGFAFVRLSRR